MKKIASLFILALIVLSSCGNSTTKPYFKTKSGKRKQKYYNDIQFGGKKASEMKKLKD